MPFLGGDVTESVSALSLAETERQGWLRQRPVAGSQQTAAPYPTPARRRHERVRVSIESTMSLSDLANIGEFLGGFAVLVSLVHLILNVRQNTLQLRDNLRVQSLTEQRSAYEQHDRYRDGLRDRDWAEVFLRITSGVQFPPGLASVADPARTSAPSPCSDYCAAQRPIRGRPEA